MKKWFWLLLASAVSLILLTVVTCELLFRSNYAYCRSLLVEEGLSCSGLREKYGVNEKEAPPLLWEIKAKRDSGERVSKQGYRSLFEEVVVTVDREDIGGYNGLACGYWGYVARDLPSAADKFVRRHELAHILGEENEFQANKEAFLEYPLGGTQTAAITAWRALGASDQSLVCRIALLWARFKEYCLPGSWEPPVTIF